MYDHGKQKIHNSEHPYPRSLHTNIIKNNRKTILNRKPNNVLNNYKYVFENWYDLSIPPLHFNRLKLHYPFITKLALPQLPRAHCTTYNHFLKPIFCYFISNSTKNRFHRLTNYIRYLTNPRPRQLHALHFIHLKKSLNYTT